ncbi:MAG TPA: PhzF family phenazine biosynthesis protein [Clostridiales bacterium UBA8960]|jgi:PhzF family phenazine biosynthesis protein|nr:PhzF family phenazine biosynthesis protein [Clostridiales bacterium UBA8960]
MIAQIINSFTYQHSGGNPAGVVVDLERTLCDQEMQDIARQLALSETAFVSKGHDGADFNIRFFTTTDEVDLCGHATIASFWHLAHTGLLQNYRSSQLTKAGLLSVELFPQKNGALLTMMAQAKPALIKPKFNFHEMLRSAFSDSELSNSLPLEIWSTGLKDIIMPIASRDALNSLRFDFDQLTSLSETLDVVGVHAFALDSGQIYARNFAPRFGIDEESATGTSNGALTAYLKKHLYQDHPDLSLKILQGEEMGKTSAIYTSYRVSDSHESIWVGGYCTLIEEINL